MPVVFGVMVPSFHIESMLVIEHADSCGLGVAANGASVGLYALGCFGGLGGDDALVPYMLCFVFFQVGMRACCGMPVRLFVELPVAHIKRVFEFGNGFRFLISTHRTSESFHTLSGFRGLSGDNACIESMICFVRHVRVFFSHTFVPVACFVILPLA